MVIYSDRERDRLVHTKPTLSYLTWGGNNGKIKQKKKKIIFFCFFFENYSISLRIFLIHDAQVNFSWFFFWSPLTPRWRPSLTSERLIGYQPASLHGCKVLKAYLCLNQAWKWRKTLKHTLINSTFLICIILPQVQIF